MSDDNIVTCVRCGLLDVVHAAAEDCIAALQGAAELNRRAIRNGRADKAALFAERERLREVLNAVGEYAAEEYQQAGNAALSAPVPDLTGSQINTILDPFIEIVRRCEAALAPPACAEGRGCGGSRLVIVAAPAPGHECDPAEEVCGDPGHIQYGPCPLCSSPAAGVREALDALAEAAALAGHAAGLTEEYPVNQSRIYKLVDACLARITALPMDRTALREHDRALVRAVVERCAKEAEDVDSDGADVASEHIRAIAADAAVDKLIKEVSR